MYCFNFDQLVPTNPALIHMIHETQRYTSWKFFSTIKLIIEECIVTSEKNCSLPQTEISLEIIILRNPILAQLLHMDNIDI